MPTNFLWQINGLFRSVLFQLTQLDTTFDQKEFFKAVLPFSYRMSFFL